MKSGESMTDEWDEILSTPQIEEQYDATWPYNFKWGHDPESGRTDVWHVKGGKDGRPVHRRELEDRWGRPPKVGEGDVMGLATYIPPEVKFDGTVVAPPEVHVQTYYDKPTPPSVYQWFNQQFPHAVVRDALIVPGKKQVFGKTAAEDWDFTPTPPAPEVLKWVFNRKNGLLLWEAYGEDGLPTHQQKVMAEWHRPMTLTSDWDAINGQDEIGYAYPSEEKVELQRWDYKPISPEAKSALRAQLSEWYPKAQVEDEYGASPDSFGTDPKDWHTATVNWAWETLVESHPDRSESHFDATERKSGLLARLFRKKPVWEKTAEADMEGCMVALFLDEKDGNKLKIRGGEPVENMHITLCYFVDKQADRDDWDEVMRIVEQTANQHPPMTGKISGYGTFQSDEGDVLWASPAVQGLAELRHKIFEAVEDAGFTVSKEYDWVPHITLKYNHRGKLPKNKEVELEFKNLSFAGGPDQHHFELKGNLEKTTAFARPWGYTDIDHYGPMPERLYHVAPRWARESILREGLDPTGRTWNTGAGFDDWNPETGIIGDPDDENADYEYRPEGIYMFEHHNQARDYARWGGPEDQWQPESAHDIWEINRHAIPGEIIRDPSVAHNWDWEPDWHAYVAEYVPTNALRLVEPQEHLASDDYLDWSGWEGSHQFVTDGKEILTTPATERIDSTMTGQHPPLLKHFQEIYPKAKSFTSGWAIPTADGMGVGIWAPSAGMGDEHEPGVHEVVGLVEDKFGKPAHFITNGDHLADEGMYRQGLDSEWQTL